MPTSHAFPSLENSIIQGSSSASTLSQRHRWAIEFSEEEQGKKIQGTSWAK